MLGIPAPLDLDALRALIDVGDVRALKTYMEGHSRAFAVAWREQPDPGHWECAWQVGQRKIVGTSWHPRVAIVAAATQALGVR